MVSLTTGSPAAAVIGAGGGQVDLGAVPGDGDGGVLVEVVGQLAEAGDEGLAENRAFTHFSIDDVSGSLFAFFRQWISAST